VGRRRQRAGREATAERGGGGGGGSRGCGCGCPLGVHVHRAQSPSWVSQVLFGPAAPPPPAPPRAGMRLSAGVANELRVSSAKAAAARIRAGDKSDRATVEQALDPRTRMVG